MNRPLLCLLSLAALLGALPCAQAQSALRWENKTVETHPGQGEKTARGDFEFTNTSNQPVVIDSVKPGCGCTTVGLEKKIYQPGEKGHITAVLTLGSHKGMLAKGITVNVRGERQPTVLMLVAQVEDSVKIDPPLVFWRNGEAPRSKTIKLRIPAGLGLRLARVLSNEPKIAATWDTIQDGTEYRITVTPEDTSRRTMAVLTIQALTRSNEARVYQAYAQVKAP